MISFGSVCSGISAASVAWGDLGFKAAWFAEVDPFASSVLKHHYPHVPNMGDMTQLAMLVRMGLIEAPDVLEGGTPCQAFSVAGARAGLLDPRGQLTLSFADLANAIDEKRPSDECVIVWENVPGVLSDKSNAFGCFLGILAGEDEPLVAPGGKWPNAGVVVGPQRAIAWRVTDAQYFGVAQPRRRVFLIASARHGFDPAAVLFEFEGTRRDIAPPQCEGHPHEADEVDPPDNCWWDGGQLSQTLDAVMYKKQTLPEKSRFPAVIDGGRLRFITPRECERLQAFPDDYTLVPHRGKPAADGPRYKALGNSMCTSNMRWIGKRLLTNSSITA